MKIKNYIQFIKESTLEDFNSLGEWVESLIGDEYIRNIVSRYTQDITPDINLSNSINVLDEMVKNDIKLQIEKYLNNGIEDKEPEVTASTDTEELLESQDVTGGKGIFTSFMKSITALGKKDMEANLVKCPDDYLIFYIYDDLNSQDVKQIFGRFKSLIRFTGMIDYDKNEIGLYYGVKCDGTFEYGISHDSINKSIGHFKLNSSSLRWLVNMSVSSMASLKRNLVNLAMSDIVTFGKIKTDMKDFNPGYHEKRSTPYLMDKVISFGYYGIGKWDNGKLDESELVSLKNKFSAWVLSKKWGSKVLVSIKPNSFWLFIHLKLK